MVLLYLLNIFRTGLIIIGVIFVIRLIGRMMIAKRNLNEQNRLQQEIKRAADESEEARKNFGRTTISKIGKDKIDQGDFIEFEEIDE